MRYGGRRGRGGDGSGSRRGVWGGGAGGGGEAAGVWAREGVIEIGLWRGWWVGAVGFFLKIFFQGGWIQGFSFWEVRGQVPGVYRMQDLRFCVCFFLYFTTAVLGCRRRLFKGYKLGAFFAVRFVRMLLLYLNNKVISQEYTEQGCCTIVLIA